MKNLFATFIDLLEVRHTRSYSELYSNEHPHKHNLYGLSNIKHLLPVARFVEAWTGVVLLAEPSENTIEPDCKEHRKTELFSLLKKIVLCASLGLIVAFAYIYNILYSMRKKTSRFRYGLLILFIFMIVSCDNKKDKLSINIIPVESTVGNYSILNLSDYVTDIKYIPLETNKSALIGRIHQIIYENEKILIINYTSITSAYLFDHDGKFRYKIGQYGQGPDDYLTILSVSIHENLIYLSDRLKILIYDTNGRLVKKHNFMPNEIPAEYTSHGLLTIIPLKKDTFVMNVVSMTGYYPKAILFEMSQSNLKVIKEYPGSVTLDKLNKGFIGDELGLIYRFKDEVRTYKAINDTIFTIGQNTEMKDAFIFDLETYRPTLAYWERKEGDWITSVRKFIIPKNIYESTNHLFIEFGFGDHAPEPIELTNNQGRQFFNTNVYSVFDKRTGKLTLMSQPIKGKIGFKNDIDNGPVIWPHYISSNNELIMHINAEDFLEYYEQIENPTPQMTEIAKNIKWDDNPIIIIAKLKE